MIQQAQKNLFGQDWDKARSNIQFNAPYKEKWGSLIPLFEQISANNSLFIMIWNMFTNRFIYVVDKKKVCGYDTSLYLADNGIEFSMSNMHPKFVDSVVTMQQHGSIFFLTEQGGIKQETVVNMEGVYKRITGEYFHYLQQTVCIETDSQDNPFLFLSYVHDISYLKKDKTINLVITTPNITEWWNFNFDKNCLETVSPLSKQEKKILFFLAEGRSSKEIAKRLFISPLTVDTHRKHLLKKTNCVDTTGMITYLRLVGLI